jgi:hypothetical protein
MKRLRFQAIPKQPKMTVQIKKKKSWNNINSYCNHSQTSSKQEEKPEDRSRRILEKEDKKVRIMNKIK